MIWFGIETMRDFFFRQAAVFEFEWGKNNSVDRHSELDSDFQKLVQSRSDVRVWVYSVPNSDTLLKHVDNCKKQILLFPGSIDGDKYVFIINDWGAKKTFVNSFVFKVL